MAALVNRFQTNADRDATNYNGVGLIDRIAAELGTGIIGSLQLTLRLLRELLLFSGRDISLLFNITYLNKILREKNLSIKVVITSEDIQP